MPDLPENSLRATVTRLIAGQVSAAELVDAALAAADAAQAPGAVVTLDAERARDAVQGSVSGPLHGVPVLVKDIIDVAGLPTRAGSAATDSAAAATDAVIVSRLRRAGAIVIGKSATHELAYGVVTPQVRNPRDPGVIAGGSSGGSAAAVAAGIVPLALATDTAGSVRIPAACCRVAGLIPAPGTLPRAGILPLSASFDTLGPIVSEPGDLALAWQALAGPAEGMLRGAKVVAEELLGRVDPEASAHVQAVAERLAVPVVTTPASGEGAPPPFGSWAGPRAVVIGDEALHAHRQAGIYPDHADQLGADILEYHRGAESRSAAEVEEGRVQLQQLARQLRNAIGVGEVLLTPALPTVPPAVGVSPLAAGRLTRLVAPVNAAGLAAAVVPHGRCGVQLIAADVATLLAALARL